MNFQTYLMDLDDTTLLNLHNEYCDDINAPDDIIFDMDRFDGIMEGKTPSAIVDSIAEKFNTGHDYFQFNGYGHAVSSDFVGDFISFSDLADWLFENEHEVYNDYLEENEENN